ncbi:hypothetical protein [Mycobacterium paraterrae]|uniref:Uncharacterized protein n=1 Tax=Mycobacterium paraterrae TaxID=577492 RepID=A0ABY5U6X4_9MYCO|nr:hypothetical protein [Mycobacterium paraterrae]UWI82307.1 hypothetical protein MKK62_26380 [Mycobacterium paraterrae]
MLRSARPGNRTSDDGVEAGSEAESTPADHRISAKVAIDHAKAATGLAAELWSTAVAASDAWPEYRLIPDQVQGLGLAVGITDEQ